MMNMRVTLQAPGRTIAVSSSGSRGQRIPSAASQEHTTIITACSNIHDIVVNSWIVLLVGFYIFFIDKVPDKPD